MFPRRLFESLLLMCLLCVPALAQAEGGLYSPEVSVFAGAAYGAAGLRFSYGLNFADSHVFARVEGRGISGLRVAAGLSVSTGPEVSFHDGFYLYNGQQSGAELGVAALLDRSTTRDSALGVHLGAGTGDQQFAILASGLVPLVGDRGNWEASCNLASFAQLFMPWTWHLGH